MIGGQVAAMRMTMRYRHCVFPWARRQGKTKKRQFVIINEACITPGAYYAGIAFPDHTTAFKVAANFIDSWGGMVKAYKNNDKDQDRWIELHPVRPPFEEPPSWFTPSMAERWTRCWKGDCNTLIKVYLWSTTYPFFQKIQGFPHHFNRVDWDECQQVHPAAYGIVRPMIRDACPTTGIVGSECFSGTPWNTGVGNVKFEQWWNTAGDPDARGWFRMRIPDGTIPPWIVPRVTKEEMRGMTEQEIRQTLYAEFLTGEGAVFSNLDRVFVLKPLDPEHGALDWIRALRSRYAMPTMQWWVHQPLPQPGHVYGASIDWARSPTGDYSVLTVMDFTTAEQVALLRWRGEDFTAQMEVVLAVQAHYKAQQLHSDAQGLGLTMSDFMRRRHAVGFRGHRFGKNKPDYVRRGQILFADADVALIKCAVQRHEFKSYSMIVGGRQMVAGDTISGERQVQYGAPQGEYDDCVSAFLQIAPTMTIVGRQLPSEPEPPVPMMFDEENRTTLGRFSEGVKTPWDVIDDDAEDSWRSVVLTGR